MHSITTLVTFVMRTALVFLVAGMAMVAEVSAGETVINSTTNPNACHNRWVKCKKPCATAGENCITVIRGDRECNESGTDYGEKIGSGSGYYPSQGTSIVDNYFLNHIHQATDYEIQSPGAGSCATCGGGGGATCGGGAVDPTNLGLLEFERRHSFREVSFHSSFGAAGFSNYDIYLTFIMVDGDSKTVKAIDYVNANETATHRFFASAPNSPVFVDTTAGIQSNLTLYSSYDPVTGVGTAAAPTSGYANITYAVLNTWKGGRMVFQVGDPTRDPSPLVERRWVGTPDTTVVALPAGQVTGFGFYSPLNGSNLRFDNLTVSGAGGTVLYRETFPGTAPGSDAGNLAILEGWKSARTAKGNTNQAQIFSPGSTELAGVNNAPVGTGASTGYLCLSPKLASALFLYTHEYKGITSSLVNQVSFECKVGAGTTFQAALAIDGIWYVNATALTQTTLNVWETKTIPVGAGWRKLGVDLVDDNTERIGRLVRVVNNDGAALKIDYAVQPTGVANSNLWKMSRITDPYGNQAQIRYSPTQVAGDWAISDIDLPNGTTIHYTYDGTFLTRVDYPDGTFTTIAKGFDAVSGLVTVNYDEAGAEGVHRRKTSYLTGAYSVDSTVNQMSDQGGYMPVAMQLVRMVKNGMGEVSYANLGDKSTTYAFEGPRLKVINQTAGTIRFAQSWSMNGRTPSIANLTWVPEPTGYAPGFNESDPYSNSFNALMRGTPATETDATGYKKTFTWNSANQPLTVKHPDGTVESTTYDAFQNPLTQTDRLGRVTRSTYNEKGYLLTRTVAYGTPEAATTSNTYYPAGHVNQYRLASRTDALGNVTNFEYDAQNRLLRRIDPADVVGGSRPVTSNSYDSAGRLATVTDPQGRVMIYHYDLRSRISSIEYADGSRDQFTYGSGTDQNQLVAKTDRNGHVTTFGYDLAGRRISTTQAAGLPEAVTETATYVRGTTTVNSVTRQGDAMSYTFDYKLRPIATTRQATTGSALTESTTFDSKNRVAYTTDAYGRKAYRFYDSLNRVVRTVRELVPNGRPMVPNSNPPVLAPLDTLPRLAGVNPDYVIEDTIFDADGEVVGQVDPRGVVSTFAYDARGRRFRQIQASGQAALNATVTTIQSGAGITATPALALTQETVYDVQGNVIEQRSPRYFDVLDLNGYLKAKTVMTYNGRNMLASRTAAPGTAGYSQATYTYTPTGKVLTESVLQQTTPSTIWLTTTNEYGTCCDRLKKVTDPVGAFTQFTYDFVGNRVSVTDANGLTTVTTYDGLNRVKTMTNAAGETTTYAYFPNATTLIATDLPPAITPAQALAGLNLGATADGSAVVVTNPLGEKSVQLSDGLGRSVRSIDGNGNAMTTVYDLAVGTDKLLGVTATDALNHSVSSRADAAGRVRVSIDALGKTSTAGYDSNGNRVTWRDANGTGQDCVLDALNRDTTCTDTAVPPVVTSKVYDAAGNVVRAVDGLGKSSYATYDTQNRKIQTTDRIGAVTDFAYDNAGNLLQITDGDVATDGTRKGITKYGYDLRNLLVREEFPAQAATGTGGASIPDVRTYTYDLGRRLATRTDQLGVVTTYLYDPANRLVTRQYPDALNDTFGYDQASRLTVATSARYGTTVNRRYTTGNAPRDPAVEHAGRLLREEQIVSGKTFAVEYVYDAANRKTGVRYPVDAAGHVDPNVTVVNAYTARNQLEQVWFAGASVFARGGSVNGYDDAGRLVRSQIGTAGLFEERRSYLPGENLVGQIRSATSAAWSAAETAAGAPVGSPTVALNAASLQTGFGYSYDALKRKTIESDLAIGAWNQRFAYDDESRLNAWDRSATSAGAVGDASVSGDRQVWDLSKVGDWKSTTYRRDGVPDRTEARTHSPVHEVTGITYSGSTPPALPTPNPQPLRYDGKGNLTIDDKNLGLAWDVENRLTKAGTPTVQANGSVTVDPTIALYSYDALGRRLAKTVANGVSGAVAGTTYYVHDGAQVTVEFREGSTQALAATIGYVYGSYVDEVALVAQFGAVVAGQLPAISQRYYLLSNHLYSPAAAVSDAGGVVERYRYDAYGKRSVYAANLTALGGTGIGQLVVFTGRYLDSETGLVYFRARQYSTCLGRFVGRDPKLYIDGNGIYNAYFSPNYLDALGFRRFTYSEIWSAVNADVDAIISEQAEKYKNTLLTKDQRDKILNGWIDEIKGKYAAQTCLGIEVNCDSTPTAIFEDKNGSLWANRAFTAEAGYSGWVFWALVKLEANVNLKINIETRFEVKMKLCECCINKKNTTFIKEFIDIKPQGGWPKYSIGDKTFGFNWAWDAGIETSKWNDVSDIKTGKVAVKWE